MTFEEIREEQADKMAFKGIAKALHLFEKKFVDKYVDKYTNKFVQRLGYRKAKWLPCVYVLLSLLFVLNVMACYARPDFLT